MIRELLSSDKQQWEELYKAYAEFYKVPMNNEILSTVWNWLHDKKHVLKGICYEIDSKIVGIAHYRTMPRPIKGQYIGFLDDLFVDPNFRNQKIGKKLIKNLEEKTKHNDWQAIRWVTHSDNDIAKKLYDKIANNTGFQLYELKRN